LLRSPTEIDALLAVDDPVADEEDELEVAGAELLLELLELLQPAATSTAFADTEYNGVPRSFTQTCRERHVRDQIRITRSQLTGLLAEMLDLCGETFPLTLS